MRKLCQSIYDLSDEVGKTSEKTQRLSWFGFCSDKQSLKKFYNNAAAVIEVITGILSQPQATSTVKRLHGVSGVCLDVASRRCTNKKGVRTNGG